MLLFANNVKPTTVPPYNKGVLAIFALLACMFIISCCGMSPNLNLKQSWPTAFASVRKSICDRLFFPLWTIHGMLTFR